MPEQPAIISETQPKFANKTEYFANLILKYYPEMKFLLQQGKLTRRNSNNELSNDTSQNWSNVIEHCLVEVAAAEAFALALKLNLEETRRLCQAAALHDWDKRLEIRGSKDFSETEKELAATMLTAMKPDMEILSSTHAEFLEHWINDQPRSFLQKLFCYIDNICEGSNITSPATRLRATAERQKKLANSQEWSQKVRQKLVSTGKLTSNNATTVNYFDGQLAAQEEFAEELFKKLVDGGHPLESPGAIPNFIKNAIEKNYLPQKP